mmetsp:Transcript_8318/g.15005  ORF Transcript_8318/g.15005 Transcript_8318/m.15005 type:complete len:259 (-) Transcript_8318:501-1277(-)
MSCDTSSGAVDCVIRVRSSHANPATSSGLPISRCISFHTRVRNARVVCMPFTITSLRLYRYAPIAADSGTTTSGPCSGTLALAASGGLSRTMLPAWSSASTVIEGLGPPSISRPAQIRSTMHGTTSTFPSSCACRSFTAAESFSHAYSTGRSSSSLSGSILNLGPSHDATPLPREQLNELAFWSRKSQVWVSLDRTRCPQPSREQPKASSTSHASSLIPVSVTNFSGLHVLPLTLSCTKSASELVSLLHALEGRCRMT